MKQFLIITIPFLLLSSISFASNRNNGNKVVFVDYQEKVYQVTMRDIGNLQKIENLEEKYIPQADWHQIISHSEPEIAKSLIEKLASYLPKDELWPYIETGLLRKENKLNNLVADTAYKHWEIFVTGIELTELPKSRYRKVKTS